MNYFYPRSPRGERRLERKTKRICDRKISIHAPREGSDTVRWERKCKAIRISIHAPREGSDSKCAEK